jgi:hypothetical protein
MARRSLSSQVLEELDRARGLLEPIQDIVDPMTSHMVGSVLTSLHRIEGMCLAAMQRDMDAVTAPSPLAIVFEGDKLDQVRRRQAASTKRPGHARKDKA